MGISGKLAEVDVGAKVRVPGSYYIKYHLSAEILISGVLGLRLMGVFPGLAGGSYFLQIREHLG